MEYTCQDGAVANRQLVNTNFLGSPRDANFSCMNMVDTETKIAMIMDPKVREGHVVSSCRHIEYTSKIIDINSVGCPCE